MCAPSFSISLFFFSFSVSHNRDRAFSRSISRFRARVRSNAREHVAGVFPRRETRVLRARSRSEPSRADSGLVDGSLSAGFGFHSLCNSIPRNPAGYSRLLPLASPHLPTLYTTVIVVVVVVSPLDIPNRHPRDSPKWSDHPVGAAGSLPPTSRINLD